MHAEQRMAYPRHGEKSSLIGPSRQEREQEQGMTLEGEWVFTQQMGLLFWNILFLVHCKILKMFKHGITLLDLCLIKITLDIVLMNFSKGRGKWGKLENCDITEVKDNSFLE